MVPEENNLLSGLANYRRITVLANCRGIRDCNPPQNCVANFLSDRENRGTDRNWLRAVFSIILVVVAGVSTL